MAVLNNVFFAYTRINKPEDCFDKAKGKEYKTDVIVSKEQAKAWNKQFKKQKAKEIDNEEFEAKYKIAPPFPDQDEQYVFTLRKKSTYADGSPLSEEHRPKVLQPIPGKNGNRDITFKTLVGNGSKGALQYREVDTNEYGVNAQLVAIRVDNLVEYKGGVGPAGEELGGVSEDDGPSELGNTVEEPKETPKAETPKDESGVAPKKTRGKPAEQKTEEDGDGPF